jgi:hydroxymethylpyrimidine pyrophosphatase-like HAD family hydrolase
MLVLGFDGILLGQDKGLRRAAIPLIRKALDQGKCVVLSSCRVMTEIFDYCGNDDLGCIPYAILSMGTELYDFRGKGLVRTHLLPSTMVRRVLEVTASRDVVLHVVRRGVFNGSAADLDPARLADFHLDHKTGVYDHIVSRDMDLRDFVSENINDIERLIVYNRSFEECADTNDRLRDCPVSLAYQHATGLHISPFGVCKATGLCELARELGISMDEVMAVGYSKNDEQLCKMAGCSVAMGGAVQSVKDWCDLEVADSDHDGAAEVLERYFL